MENTSWWTQVTRTYFLNFDWEMMTYWAIIGFWHATAYYRVAQDRALKASQLETRLAEAQLQALQRQLHPHFLFNTLNAISALMHHDVEAADRCWPGSAICCVSRSTSAARRRWRSRTSSSSSQKYLEIEQTRFGDRLVVRFDIEPETLDARVPNLILQPLVENSIRHAMAVRVEPGLIEVRARRVGDNLELTVRDNGPGCPRRRHAAGRRASGSPTRGRGSSTSTAPRSN